MLKKAILLFNFFLCLFLFTDKVFAKEAGIYYFYGQGCSHCATVETYFKDSRILEKYPVTKLETYNNKDNALLLNQFFERYQVPVGERGVPAVFFREKYLVGDKAIIAQFATLAAAHYSGGAVVQPEGFPSAAALPPTQISLPLVISGALADAINPCAFAVLIILLSAMTIVKRDKTALFGGLAFTAAVFSAYFLMGLGVFKALGFAGLPAIFLKIIGVGAILLGLWNLKDFFAYKRFLPPLEIPFSWRPRLQSLLRRVTSPAGAFAVGFLVALFLLPCSSGPYLIILGMLSQKTTFTSAIPFLLLYNFIFILPMLVITLGVYFGLEPARLETIRQKNIQRLHLLAGVILTLLGLGIIVFY